MASPQVERVLGEIAQMSEDEQGELLNGLPAALHRSAGSSRLSTDAVVRAIAAREGVRRRHAGTGDAGSSISADLEEVREGRLAELSDDGPETDSRQ